MNFKTFLRECLLKEGGNAFDNVERIEQQNINPTIEKYIKPLLNKLGIKNWKLLGSALKKDDSSGDLDIGILWSELVNKFNLEEKEFSKKAIMDIVAKANIEYEVKTFGNLFMMAIPIEGQDGYVQTDFMVFDDLDYAEIAKWVPEKGTSKYKSKVKTLLWYSILMYLRFDEKYIKDDLIEYKQYVTNDKGLFLKTLSRKGKRGINKNFKTINKEFITNNWNKIWDMFLGSDFTRNDWNSFESLLSYMKSDKFKYRNDLNEILDIAKEILEKNNINTDLL